MHSKFSMDYRLKERSRKRTLTLYTVHVLAKFEAFSIGSTSEIYERYKFNRRVQEDGECIDAIVAALQNLAKLCNCTPLTDTLTRDRIVIGVWDNSVRKKLLQATSLQLQDCIDIIL